MNRAFTTLAVAALGMSLLAGCGQNGGSSADANVIKIGVNYELSGPVATYGSTSVEGIEMAFDEINAKGGINGKKVELVKYDNKSEPAEATTLATKLITQDGVVAIIGPATSGSFKATIPVANQNQVPVISGSATADDVTTDAAGKMQPFAFRTCFKDAFQGTAMANFAMTEKKATKAVILKDTSSDYAKGLADAFRETFTSKGGKVLDEQGYTAGETDFKAVLTNLKGNDFDVMYVPGYYTEVGLIIKQARELGIDAPIMGGDGFDSPKLLELAGASALNNVYYTNHYSALDTQNKKLQDFLAAFKTKYGAEPGAFAALGYDTAYFIADAISKSKDLKGPDARDAMANYKGFDGVTGQFDMDPATHDPIKTALVISLKDGVQDSATRVS